MGRIKIGVIGTGIIGKSHLENYSKIPEVELAALCDVCPETLAGAAERFGVKDTYADFRDLLKRDDITAVDVCVHNNLHAPITIAALKAGKHVYCEKPMAGSYKDALAMREAAARLGLKLHIQLATLYSRENWIAKDIIDKGWLGRIYHARSVGYRRRGRPYVDGYATKEFVNSKYSAGGALFDMGVYHISQILFLAGLPEVERVTGRTYQENPMDAKRREISGYDVEELGLGFVNFAGGMSLDILEAWSINVNPFDGSFIVGSEGGVRLEPLSFHKSDGDLAMDTKFDVGIYDYRSRMLRDHYDAYKSSQGHWAAALAGEVPLLDTSGTALQTALISEGIFMSQKLGREVTAAEIKAGSASRSMTRQDVGGGKVIEYEAI